MNKLPIGQTIAFGYAFLITEYRTVLRICWIPALLIVALEYLSRRYTFYYAEQAAGANSGLFDFVVLFFTMAVTLFASSVMAVGITRAVMGRPLDQGNIYFPIGRTELHMMSANIRYVLAVFVLFFFAALISWLALLLAGVEIGQPVESQPEGLAVFFATLISAMIFGYVLVVVVRLAFFLPAVVVAEDAGLERAHSVASGNLWRIFVVFFAIVLPVLIAGAICQAAIVQAVLSPDALSGGLEDVFQNVEVAAAAQPLLWAAYGFVMNVTIMGILPSTAAFAYMKVAGWGVGDSRSDATPPPHA